MKKTASALRHGNAKATNTSDRLNKYRLGLVCAVLAAATFAVFTPVLYCEFAGYDDDQYVTNNEFIKNGFSLKSATWAFTTDYAGNWHPLTWLSHMADWRFFAGNPCGHHLVNLLFHTANTLLLFYILYVMTSAMWQSAFVAVLFALHPLHVESVAWISERKDVLSGFLWLLTMAAYFQFTKHPTKSRYIIILAVFILGLMAKPMLVTLPFVLLLLDYWPLGRLEDRRNFYPLFLEKIPLFILSAVSCVITFLVQLKSGSVKTVEAFPLSIRLANVFISYIRYIGKLIWPTHLAVYYPHFGTSLFSWQTILSILTLAAITFLAFRYARNRKYLSVGWLWYLGTLVPVIGLVQVGGQSIADRYTYLPSIGLFIIFSWGIGELAVKLRLHKIAIITSAIIVIVAMFVCTRTQLQYWHDRNTLYTHALEVTDTNYMMHYDLGVAFASQNKFDEASDHYRRALEIKPDYALAHNNLAILLASQGRFDEAVTHYRQALSADPNYAQAHNNLAVTLQSQGKVDEAFIHYRKAIQINPEFAESHDNLARLLLSQGKPDEAVKHFSQALKAKKDNPELHYNIAGALFNLGRLDEAISHYRMALQIKPDYAQAHINLGIALEENGNIPEAMEHCRQSLSLKPDWPRAMIVFSRFLVNHPEAGRHDANEAITLALRAAELTKYRDIAVLDTLAGAYAAAGQFEQAAATAEKELALASASENKELSDIIRRQIELYRQQKR